MPAPRPCSSSSRSACAISSSSLQPDRFDDLTAIVALFRPGPACRWPTEFINRKHGASALVDYLHPKLESDLEADLRRDPLPRASDADRAGARGLLARRRGSATPRDGQEEARGDGAATRGVSSRARPSAASSVSSRPSHLRSHGDVRRLRIQQIACRGLRVDRVPNGVAQDAFPRGVHGRRPHCGSRQHRSARRAQGRLHANSGITLEPPDVNRSVFAFTVAGRKRISYGLGALKGMGQGAVDALVTERDARGPYKSLLDLCRRVDLQKINRRCSRRWCVPARSIRSARIARR